MKNKKLLKLLLILSLIACLAECFTPPKAKADPSGYTVGSAGPGQLQFPITSSTAVSNLNFIPPNTTINYNLPGWTTNNPLYATGQLSAPVFSAVGASRIEMSDQFNDTATNTTTKTITWYVSNDNSTWLPANSLGITGQSAITTLNTNYATTNSFSWGTNWNTAGWPYWAEQSVTWSGAAGYMTNDVMKIYTPSGGL